MLVRPPRLHSSGTSFLLCVSPSLLTAGDRRTVPSASSLAATTRSHTMTPEEKEREPRLVYCVPPPLPGLSATVAFGGSSASYSQQGVAPLKKQRALLVKYDGVGNNAAKAAFKQARRSPLTSPRHPGANRRCCRLNDTKRPRPGSAIVCCHGCARTTALPVRHDCGRPCSVRRDLSAQTETNGTRSGLLRSRRTNIAC